MEVQTFQQTDPAQEDKEAQVQQDAQRQHGKADPKIHNLPFEHIVAHPLQFASRGLRRLRRSVKEVRRIDLGEERTTRVQGGPHGLGRQGAQGCHPFIYAQPEGRSLLGRGGGFCHDRDMRPCRSFFDVKAAGGGPLLDRATGRRHPKHPQGHDPAEGMHETDAVELHALKVVQLPCLQVKLTPP